MGQAARLFAEDLIMQSRRHTKNAGRQRLTSKAEDNKPLENLKRSVWFHEKQLMPLLSPFWAWRIKER
jgi:hypothetical protein